MAEDEVPCGHHHSLTLLRIAYITEIKQTQSVYLIQIRPSLICVV
jgi:hypothetical protein